MSNDGSPASFRLSLPRLDQDPLNFTDDYSEIISILSQSDSELSDLFIPERDNGEYREIGGRLFSKQNPMYFLPLDEEEFKRLDKQHHLLRLGLWGLYPATSLIQDMLSKSRNNAPPQDVPKTILDLGCGSGQWAFSMAHEFPHVQIVALDHVRKLDETLPPNVSFELHDINEGLSPFYNSYDIVHARCVASGMRSYRALLEEVYKCLKPGGIAIFLEGDLDLFNEKKNAIIEPASEANPDGSYLQRWLQRTRQAQIRICNLSGVDDSPETLDKGLWQFNVYEPHSCATGSIFTPICPWPTSDLPEELLHFKIAGILMRQMLKLFILSTEQLLLQDGVDKDDLATWSEKIREELDDDNTSKAWIRWRVAWGRKPNPNAEANASSSGQHHTPQVIPSQRREAARQQLRSIIKQFRIQQFYIRNREQSLADVERREKMQYSNRGKFF